MSKIVLIFIENTSKFLNKLILTDPVEQCQRISNRHD